MVLHICFFFLFFASSSYYKLIVSIWLEAQFVATETKAIFFMHTTWNRTSKGRKVVDSYKCLFIFIIMHNNNCGFHNVE